MSKTIPLIHKAAAIIQLDILKQYVEDVWPIVNEAQLPIYLESTSAQYIPFRVLSRLLQATFEQLPAQEFTTFIQQGAERYSMVIDTIKPSTKTKRPLLDVLGEALPIQRAEFLYSSFSKQNSQLCIELKVEDMDPFGFVCELYAICVAHHYLTRERSDIKEPSKYHLVSQEKSGLDKLQISTDTPQFMGQVSTALFYRSSTETSTSTQQLTWKKNSQPFVKQLSNALEGYIGRQDLSLEAFSGIIGMSVRTIQRYLTHDGSSYREIKESLNMTFAKRVMIERDASISDISEHLGYTNPSQFIRAFKRVENITPLQWRKQTKTARKP
ncbi:helix-turn-helix domain-containing protein [Aliivibrio fischeri]|uniref:helix-turn-helix domain-containing protein n=1 Tax=Aliivibrio fischeri TaxID=668 RepID=UPI0012D893F3|nr:AraC family transcriptional regulator [Aliivibrio fischeri]MUK62360.1 helix-turn-helix domain-containing protein [Aliivibrio fischeri]MUL03169.1 helix-turn-helix domain-containing protein [Aliivibrio fischeri]MUL21370.1 helix-turn-helix domain-containing protein [Aliivibrio fischeri]MUL23607.1 helix-turn-helix domain-containing protein [Aliivibrio fischeri]